MNNKSDPRVAFSMEISNAAHRKHCRIAECKHPAIYPGFGMGWCARCRAVAFGGVYEGFAFIGGKVVEVGK